MSAGDNIMVPVGTANMLPPGYEKEKVKHHLINCAEADGLGSGRRL